MKAVRVTEFGGTERLHLEDVPPLVPGPNEVIVSMRAAGVNPVDTYIRSGRYSVRPDLPYTPGIDGAGVVSSIGPDVSSVLLEQRVYVSRPHVSRPWIGTYAEQCLCRIENVHSLPDNITFEQGAALGIPYRTAHRALFQLAQARAGDTVLVHGASGGVGMAAVQFARAHEMAVIGTASTDLGRDRVLRAGAHYVLNHDSHALARQVATLTGGVGPNLILEMMAHRNLAVDLAMVAPRGKIVVVGNRGTTEVNMRDAMCKDVTIYAMMVFNATTSEVKETTAAITAGLQLGSLKPLIGRTFRLQDAAEAHDALMSVTERAVGKIVLII